MFGLSLDGEGCVARVLHLELLSRFIWVCALFVGIK